MDHISEYWCLTEFSRWYTYIHDLHTYHYTYSSPCLDLWQCCIGSKGLVCLKKSLLWIALFFLKLLEMSKSIKTIPKSDWSSEIIYITRYSEYFKSALSNHWVIGISFIIYLFYERYGINCHGVVEDEHHFYLYVLFINNNEVNIFHFWIIIT